MIQQLDAFLYWGHRVPAAGAVTARLVVARYPWACGPGADHWAGVRPSLKQQPRACGRASGDVAGGIEHASPSAVVHRHRAGLNSRQPQLQRSR